MEGLGLIPICFSPRANLDSPGLSTLKSIYGRIIGDMGFDFPTEPQFVDLGEEDEIPMLAWVVPACVKDVIVERLQEHGDFLYALWDFKEHHCKHVVAAVVPADIVSALMSFVSSAASP